MQKHGDRYVWITRLLSRFLPKRWTAFLRCRKARATSGLWQCPYSGLRNDPFSVNIMRGCFGGCSFCSITDTKGALFRAVRKIRSLMRSKHPRHRSRFYGRDFRSRWANCNMYMLRCKSPRAEQTCRRLSAFIRIFVRTWTLTTNRRSTLSPCA